MKYRYASNCCKRLLEAAKLAYTNKTRDSLISMKLGSCECSQLVNSVLKKYNSGVPFLFIGFDVLSYAFHKVKLFAENFSKNSNLDDSDISLPAYPAITNLNMHNIPVTRKLIKKVITNIDLSKMSDPNWSEPEFSHILGELFNASKGI